MRNLVRTEKIDAYEQVVALDKKENVSVMQYGELGQGHPYILKSDIEALLTRCTRTMSERYGFIQSRQLNVNTIYVDGAEDIIALTTRPGAVICGHAEGFTDLTEAVDYAMDMEEMGHSFNIQ